MKSKATTYLLIAGVVIIWGVILWKVLTPKDDAVRPRPAPEKRVEVKAADTLTLDYRDPFLGAAARPKKPAVLPAAKPRTDPPPKPPEPEVVHKLRYMGRITKDNVAYGLVEIGGTLHTMKTGETVGDYRMETLWQDSVRLKWKDKALTVRLGQ